jgi:NitT/TauT family transport system substrate-binding protein
MRRSRGPVAAQLLLMTLNSLTHVRLWCLLLAGIGAAGCSKSSESVKTASHEVPAGGQQLLKVEFQLDWYPTPEHGGEYQALVKNYYRQGGLDVTIAPGGPGSYGIQRVAAGQVQLSMGACDDVVLAVRHGAPLLIVGAHMEHNPQAILVHDESPVKSLRDLDGKSVMANAGSAWIDFLQSRYGITFNIVPMNYGLARFMADRNFIQQCFITNEPYYVELKGVKARALLIADAGYDPYRVIFTNRTFAREHPEAIKAFVAATIRGWVDYLHGDPSEARARIQAEDQAQTPALMDYSIDKMKHYGLVEGDPAKGERAGLLTPARMTALVRSLVDLKILDAPLPLESFVSFDFLPAETKAAKI